MKNLTKDGKIALHVLNQRKNLMSYLDYEIAREVIMKVYKIK